MPRSKLPRGPHHLSRDQVAQSQRDRLLESIAAVVASKGYAKTSVGDVLEHAGVSRATFYQLFSNKEDCFRAAYDAFAARVAALMKSILEGVRLAGEQEPLVILDRVMTTYLAALQHAGPLSRAFLVEVFAAGPEAIAQRRASLEAFVDVVAETHRGRRGLLGTDPDQRFAVMAIVSAVSMMVTNAVGMGDYDELPKLREPLLRLLAQVSALEAQPAGPSD